jgi:ABC-type amino acid transport substrate-binding protein
MKSIHDPLLACIVVGSLALPQHARAQGASGTIQKTRDTGVIALGVRDSSLPFSYIDGQHNHVGYAVDICLRIVEALKRELNLPQLKTEKTAVTVPPNNLNLRFPMSPPLEAAFARPTDSPDPTRTDPGASRRGVGRTQRVVRLAIRQSALQLQERSQCSERTCS